MSARPGLRLRLALAMIALLVRALPPSARKRYAAEWRADVLLSPGSELSFALGLVLGLGALRRAVTGARPLRCRLSWHADVTVHDNPENRRFTSHVCQRCGRVKDDWKGPPLSSDGWAWAAASGDMR